MDIITKAVLKSLVIILFFLASDISALALKDAYRDKFLIGVALTNKDISNSKVTNIVNTEFNVIVAEFGMKMTSILSAPEIYNFVWTDELLRHAKKNDQIVIGHTLVWHKAVPEWFFFDSKGKKLNRDQLLIRLQKYIHTYVGRYRGQVLGWDVVNEAFNLDGSMRKNLWLEIIGGDYIEKAFEFAHQADPGAELYYNDYGLVSIKKQTSVVSLVKSIRKKGIPIHAVGIQGHYSLTYPDLRALSKAIERFAELDVKVMITELDVSVLPLPRPEEISEDTEIDAARAEQLNPYPEQLPRAVAEQLTNRYLELFCVYLKHNRAISRVTFWGLTDKHTWRNNWPIQDRVDYPLLFDRALKPKPVVNALKKLVEARECSFNL